ncbi:hypothetical protein NDU88_008840 [Pleurodeles waltl]|uniref:Uncharacterized protein n=1 Tax=Pleurodeles waltl TaxID=8319 RepID=A0AAV7P226_PLEWA|nr:hypothetical protein NDU88_008840 [Pleurodeles waltl]
MRPRPGDGRIPPMPLTATRRRPQQSRREKTTPEPAHQRRQQQEDFPDAGGTNRRRRSAQTGLALGRSWTNQPRSDSKKGGRGVLSAGSVGSGGLAE